MDSNKIFDVSKPGGAPADPSSRPIIVTNQPTQVDPMMTPPAPASGQSITPPAPIDLSEVDGPTEEPSTAETTTDTSDIPADTSEETVASAEPITPAYSESMATTEPEQPPAEPLHKMAHEQAFYGEIAKPHTFLKKFFIFIIVAAIVGGGAFGGWKYLEKKKQDDRVAVQKAAAEEATKKAAAAAAEKAKAKVFTPKFSNFQVTNAENWPVTETETTSTYAYAAVPGSFSDVKFTVAEGQYLVFSVNPGGRGGDCEPAGKDKAFADGNVCSSEQIMSVEQLPDKNFILKHSTLKYAHAYLIEYQYKGPQDTTTYTLYGIDLTRTDEKGAELKHILKDPAMGYFLPFTSITTTDDRYLDIKLVDAQDKPIQLSEQNVTKVKAMLKSVVVKQTK